MLMQKLKRVLKRYGSLLLIASLLAIGLKFIAYAIPGERIRKNVELSASQLEIEGLYPSPFIDVWNIPSVQLDNWSDSIYLNICYYANEYNLLQSVAGDYQASVAGAENPLECFLMAIREEQPENTKLFASARQWTGVNTILRPLLYFFTFPQIRLITQYALFFLLALTAVILSRKAGIAPALFYTASLLSVNLVSASSSANLASSFFWILLCTVAAVYLYPQKADAPVLIFVAAMGSAYFDYFVVPLLSFCVLTPLLLWMGYQNEHIQSGKQGFWTLFKCGVAWISGYAGLWMIKWTFASVVLKENIFLEAFHEATGAVTGWDIAWAAEETTAQFMVSANRLNFSQIFPINLLQGRPAGIGLLVIMIFLTVYIVFRSRKTIRQWYWKAGLLLLAGFAPYAWYTVVYKHSYIHYWFTFRLQAGTLLAVLLVLAVIWKHRNLVHE